MRKANQGERALPPRARRQQTVACRPNSSSTYFSKSMLLRTSAPTLTHRARRCQRHNSRAETAEQGPRDSRSLKYSLSAFYRRRLPILVREEPMPWPPGIARRSRQICGVDLYRKFPQHICLYLSLSPWGGSVLS